MRATLRRTPCRSTESELAADYRNERGACMPQRHRVYRTIQGPDAAANGTGTYTGLCDSGLGRPPSATPSGLVYLACRRLESADIRLGRRMPDSADRWPRARRRE